MIQKRGPKKKVTQPVRRMKPAVKKLNSTVRKAGNDTSPNKAQDEAYDRGFNDGYSKGLEDCGIDS